MLLLQFWPESEEKLQTFISLLVSSFWFFALEVLSVQPASFQLHFLHGLNISGITVVLIILPSAECIWRRASPPPQTMWYAQYILMHMNIGGHRENVLKCLILFSVLTETLSRLSAAEGLDGRGDGVIT